MYVHETFVEPTCLCFFYLLVTTSLSMFFRIFLPAVPMFILSITMKPQTPHNLIHR